MARPNTAPATQRVQVNTQVSSPQYNVAAPSNVQTNAGGDLAALSKALGVITGAAGDIIVNKANNDAQRAQTDFAKGAIDPKDSTYGYQRAASMLSARASWVTDSKDIEEKIRQADPQTPDELHKLIDAHFKDLYGGLDDPNAAEVLAPRMAEFRAAQDSALQQRQFKAMSERQGADIHITAADSYAQQRKALTDANPNVDPIDISAANVFDYNGLHETIRTLFPDQTNEMYLTVLKDIAVQNGDPELLKHSPDKWTDAKTGQLVPGPQHIPEFVDKFRGAIDSAESQQASLRTARDRQIAVEQKTTRDQAEATIALKIVNGESVDLDVAAYLQSGYGDAQAGIALLNAAHTAGDRAEEKSADFGRIAQFELSFYGKDKPTPATIALEYSRGTFGTVGSEAAKKEVSRLTNTLNDVRGDAFSRPQVMNYVEALKGRYEPFKDEFSRTNPVSLQFQTEILTRYRELVMKDNGADPLKAYQQVVAEFDPMKDSIGGDPFQDAKAPPQFVIKSFAAGHTPITTLRAAVSGKSAEIDAAYARGELLDEDYAAYLEAIKP